MGGNLPNPKKNTQKKPHMDSTPPPSHDVLKRKKEIGVSRVSKSSSPTSKKTENTKKQQSNVKSTPPPSPSVVCVPSPQSQTKQKKRTPASSDMCVSSPQLNLHVGKQTDKCTPTRASERYIVSAGQPMSTNSRKRKSNVKSTPASPDVVCISSPQSHLHVAGKQTENRSPTTASKRHILSTGQPMHVQLTHPVCSRKMNPDGNCLFCAISYILTGSERQHFQLRSLIVAHVRSLTENSLADNLRDILMMLHSLEEHITCTNMAHEFIWGTDIEIAITCHLLDVNIATYAVPQGQYVVGGPWLFNVPEVPDNTRPTMFNSFTGNNFDVMLSKK